MSEEEGIYTLLGKTVSYPDQYDPNILVRENRQGNRDHLNINRDTLPFDGFDTWNCYEVSTLTNTGVPVTGALKLRYSCKSKYIVESKSLKLYLNSFNMTKMGDDTSEAIEYIVNKVRKDLSDLLDTPVAVNFFKPGNKLISRPGFWPPVEPKFDEGDWYGYWDNYQNIDHTLKFTDTYTETPELLESRKCIHTAMNEKYWSALLKSNCKVTNQPDWGDIFISMTASQLPEPKSLVKYIVSFRDECHFHEEICETAFVRLMNKFQPNELAVTCLYARRGGIDINPSRMTPNVFGCQISNENIGIEMLRDVNIPHYKSQKQ